MKEKMSFLKKEYGGMQGLLLLTTACIPFDQTLLSVMLLLTLLYGLFLARKESKEGNATDGEERVWPLFLKTVLLFLLVTGYISLHNPLIKEKTACYFNFFYVVGQYVATVWLFTRFGQKFKGQSFVVRVMIILGITALISVAGGIGQHYFGGATEAVWVDKEANPLLRNRVYSTWENPNIFAGYLCVAAAFLMGFIGVEKNPAADGSCLVFCCW